MDITYKVFPTPADLAGSLALHLIDSINAASERKSPLSIALSGGNTPKLLFSVIAGKYLKKINWKYVRLFWVDERCVHPADPESNYGMTDNLLFKQADISHRNIHRIRGEEDPDIEADRYSDEILANIHLSDNYPEFDIILLGMGEDGHTASIFPDNLELLSSEHICETAIHPVSGQRRITLTGKVINNARKVIFMVTGKNKASVVSEIIGNKPKNLSFPAAHICSTRGETTWFLDQEAAELLE